MKSFSDAAKTIVVPRLEEAGFSGKYPKFKRLFDSEVHLVTFDVNKYGGSVAVELTRLSMTEYARLSTSKFETLVTILGYEECLLATKRLRASYFTGAENDWFHYDRVWMRLFMSKQQRIIWTANRIAKKIPSIERTLKRIKRTKPNKMLC